MIGAMNAEREVRMVINGFGGTWNYSGSLQGFC